MRSLQARRARYVAVAFVALAAVVVAAVLVSAIGGEDDTAERAGSSERGGDAARVEITPATFLLTRPGEARTLAARAFDSEGMQLDVSVTWSTLKPGVVSVDPAGRVTAVGTGSAQVVASTPSGASAGALVLVATPALGAVLVADEQVRSGPAPLDPAVPPGPGALYEVTLIDVAAPAAGTVVIGTGEAPLGGRVVSAVADGADVRVVLQLVPAGELFSDLEVDEVIDFTNVPVTIPPEVEALYDVERRDGVITFTPRPPGESRRVSVPVSFQAKSEFKLGIFACETARSMLPVSLAQPAQISLETNLSLEFRYRNGLRRLVLSGKPKATVQLRLAVDVAVEAKVTCKAALATFKARKLAKGWVAAVLQFYAPEVPVGIGFEVGGKLTVASLGVQMAGDLSTDFAVGVDCPDAKNCDVVARVDPNLVVEGKPAYSDASIAWITPDPGRQFRLEPSASVFLYAELTMKSEALRGAPAIARIFAMNVFEVQVALAQKANLADAAVQIANAGYASDYKLAAEAVAEGTRDLAEFMAIYGLKAVKPKLEISQAIATSPGGSAKSDVDAFKPGERVRFTVSLDADSVRYPAIGYNVAEVRIYRKATPDPAKVASFTAPPDQTTFVLDWQADVAGTVDGNFYAFVVTSLLGFAPLEMGPVTPTSDGSSKPPAPGSGASAPRYNCDVWINTAVQGFVSARAYADPELQCHLQLMECKPDQDQYGRARYLCTYDEDRRREYIEQCGNTPEKQIARGCIPPD